MLREQARAFHRQPPPGAIVGVSGHARRRAAFVTRRIVFYLLLGYTLCAFVTTSDSSKYAYPSPSQPPLVAPQVADVKDSVVNSLVDGGNQATSNYTKPPAASITLPFWFMSAHVLYFELEVDRFKYRILTQFLHGMSLGGSLLVAVFFAVLMSLERGQTTTIVDRYALALGVASSVGWLLAVLTHIVPVVFHMLDFFLAFDALSAHHGYFYYLEKPLTSQSVPRGVAMLLRPLWFFFGPLALTGAWALAGFSVERVYETRGIGTWPLLGIAAAVSAATTVIAFAIMQLSHSFQLRPKYSFTPVDPTITQSLLDSCNRSPALDANSYQRRNV